MEINPYSKYKTGTLSEDYESMDRKFLKGTDVIYHRSKDYEEQNEYGYPNTPKWTGQFRTHYIGKDSNGIKGSFTVFYLDLLIDKHHEQKEQRDSLQ